MEPEGNRARLSIMMFGQYLVMGSYAVTLGTFLMSPPTRGGMNFPPAYAGWIYSTFAFAAIITPLFTGLLADRFFRAEKLLGITNLIGGCLLFAAASWCTDRQQRIYQVYRSVASKQTLDGMPILDQERQLPISPSVTADAKAVDEVIQRINSASEVRAEVEGAFVPLFGIWFGYALCLIFSITLGNVVAFRNLSDPKHSYGKVRVHGTIGWIVAGLLLGSLLNPISTEPLFFAAISSFVFGLYCLTLPRTPPSGHSRSVAEAFGVPALSLFRSRAFCVLIFSALLLSAVQQFYVVYANRFLIALKVKSPAAVQTLAQVSEVIILLFFAKVLDKLGFKGAMVIGIVVWVIRNALFATGSAELVVGLALPLHGISYACFFLVASMYVDRRAPLHLRASAQGIFTFVASGAGTLLGNWTGARIVAAQTTGDSVAWTHVWIIPAIVSAVVLLLFVIFFTTASEQPSAKIEEKPTCDPTPSGAP